ncbi:MAG: NUDIX domain-containing protein [Nitrososphaerota archaeon]
MKRVPELTVGALIVARDGQILLVRSPKWFGRYSIPGGHVEAGESIMEAAAREVFEEVGLRVRPAQLIMIQEVISPRGFYELGRHFIFFDVLCMAYSKNVRIDGEEVTDHLWVKPKDALRLNLETYTRKLLSRYLSGAGKTPLWLSLASSSRRRRLGPTRLWL